MHHRPHRDQGVFGTPSPRVLRHHGLQGAQKTKRLLEPDSHDDDDDDDDDEDEDDDDDDDADYAHDGADDDYYHDSAENYAHAV